MICVYALLAHLIIEHCLIYPHQNINLFVMENNLIEVPADFVKEVVLKTILCKKKEDIDKLLISINKALKTKSLKAPTEISIEDVLAWRKNYLDTALAALKTFYDVTRDEFPKDIDPEILQTIQPYVDKFIGKAPSLFTSDSDYCRSFYESSHVSDEVRSKHASYENFIIDYEGLNYVRYMKLFQPTVSRKFPDFKFKAPLPTGVNLNKCLSNPFYLRYYLPKDLITRIPHKIFEQKNRIVIMLNGLNEHSTFGVYDILGEYFANNGMAAVLLTTPFNLNRCIDPKFTIYDNEEKKNRPTRPTDWAEQCPLLFYYSFLKTFDELRELVTKINPPLNSEFIKRGNEAPLDTTPEIAKELDRIFYKKHFWRDENQPVQTEIILLGYSLGGLKALSYFIKSPDDFRCCITLNSGPNLFRANTKALKVDRKKWWKILEELQKEVTDYEAGIINEWEKSEPENIEDVSALRKIFSALYFKDKKKDITDAIINEEHDIISRYLAINSGADRIVSKEQMNQIAPKGKHIHQLIVAGVDHSLTMDEKWHDVLPQVEDDILRFINSCIHRHYKKQEIIKAMLDILNEADDFKTHKKNYFSYNVVHEKSFDNEHFYRLIGQIGIAQEKGKYSKKDLAGKDQVEQFIQLYYSSKGFFINFSELYNEMLKTAKKKKEKRRSEKS